MRKKIVRSRTSNAKRPLQLARETIRTLSPEELTEAAGGRGAVAQVCPWNTAGTELPNDPSGV